MTRRRIKSAGAAIPMVAQLGKADEGGGQGHQHDGDGHDALASQSVAQWPPNHSAQWPQQEGDRIPEHGERRAQGRKKCLRQKGGGGSVDAVVVPLGGITHGRCRDRAVKLPPALG